MTIIQSVSVQLSNQRQPSGAAELSNTQFEALLASFDKKPKNDVEALFGTAESLIDNLLASLSGNFAQSGGVDFPFTPTFASTFGTSGPLPEYIAEVSKRLNLTAAQQVALQDIALRNKDIVKTPESVRKVAQELQAAGIGTATAT